MYYNVVNKNVQEEIAMVALIKLLVKIIKLVIALNKFGLLDEVVSGLIEIIPDEYKAELEA